MAAVCDAVQWLAAEGGRLAEVSDPLTRELLLAWRQREHMHECRMRARLAVLFQKPEGEAPAGF